MRLVRVQVVCNDDTARAPMVAAVLREELRISRAFDALDLCTAGLLVTAEGQPMDAQARAVLTAAGLEVEEHRTEQFQIDSIDEHDLVVMVEQRHIDLVASGGPPPGWRDRIRLLRELDPVACALQDTDLLDPRDRGRAAYEACLKDVRAAVPRLAAEVERMALEDRTA